MGTGTELDSKSPKARILVVDDHPVACAGLKTLLTSERDLIVVGETSDAASSMKLANELNPDVVVVAVSPRPEGAEATRRLLATAPTRKVLALALDESVAFAQALLDAGAVGYALKSTTCDELVRAIRIVASGGAYVDPSIAELLTRNGSGQLLRSLSTREAEVVRLSARGLSSKEVAQILGVSPRTIETYKARGMSKLHLSTRASLISYALRSGWLDS